MKLITITDNTGATQEFKACNINLQGDGLFYTGENGDRDYIDLTDKEINIAKAPQDKREWQVVIGRNSGNIWSQNMRVWLKENEIEVLSNLTQSEAEDLALELVEKRQEYKEKDSLEF